MDKDEILKKSREENENGDERQLTYVKLSFSLSFLVTMVFCVGFLIYGSIKVIPEVKFVSLTIIFISTATHYLVMYITTKKTFYLVITIIGFIIAIENVIRLFL